jgi:hypothetical protein
MWFAIIVKMSLLKMNRNSYRRKDHPFLLVIKGLAVSFAGICGVGTGSISGQDG